MEGLQARRVRPRRSRSPPRGRRIMRCAGLAVRPPPLRQHLLDGHAAALPYAPLVEPLKPPPTPSRASIARKAVEVAVEAGVVVQLLPGQMAEDVPHRPALAPGRAIPALIVEPREVTVQTGGLCVEDVERIEIRQRDSSDSGVMPSAIPREGEVERQVTCAGGCLQDATGAESDPETTAAGARSRLGRPFAAGAVPLPRSRKARSAGASARVPGPADRGANRADARRSRRRRLRPAYDHTLFPECCRTGVNVHTGTVSTSFYVDPRCSDVGTGLWADAGRAFLTNVDLPRG